MALRDLFATTLNCPACHSPWAKKSLFGGVRCPNPECRHHDPRLRGTSDAPASAGPAPRPGRRAEKPFPEPADRVVIRYRNFRGEEKRFEADPSSLRVRGAHVSVRVAPTGRRISLKKDSIGNRDEVLAAAAKVPPAGERKILTYHLRRGTTSERFEEARRRHPDWRPPGVR